MSGCLFCAIAAGEIPADVVARTESAVAFRDINPQAPVHVLVIPVAHHPNLAALAAHDASAAGDLMAMATQVAQSEGLESGYRIVLNTGTDGGQTVDHVHAHVLGGRGLTWPPG